MTAQSFSPAKRGDLVAIPRRLSSTSAKNFRQTVSTYYELARVASVSRDGLVKAIEQHGRPINLRHILTNGAPMVLSSAKVDVDGVLSAASALPFFADLDTADKLRDFVRPFVRA